jgi:hypothetical protein
LTRNTRIRAAALLSSLAIAFSGAAAIAVPASAASAGATAFSNCMDHYLAAQRSALNSHQSAVATAILYTGYTFCYYDLSQRDDITGQQEINAVNNYNHYLALAQQAVAKASLIYYGHILRSFSLRGLGI